MIKLTKIEIFHRPKTKMNADDIKDVIFDNAEGFCSCNNGG